MNARAQNNRRGGFIRIFPTPDSMQRYGMFLDSSTGIPVSIKNSTVASTFSTHNLNQLLHNQLFAGATRNQLTTILLMNV